MSALHEMWRLASTPPAPLIWGLMFIALAWAIAFRKQDRDAWAMCAAMIGLAVIETGAHAFIKGDAFRAFLAVSDTLCAAVAFKLGSRTHREWLLFTYATCVYSVTLHVLWLLGPAKMVLAQNNYVAALNVLLVVRLLAVSFPGLAHVGKAVSGRLLGGRAVPAPHRARR